AQNVLPVLERKQQLLALDLLRRPRERQSLDAFGVSVLRGCEAATLELKLSQRVLDRLLDYAPVAVLSRHEPAMQVRRDQQRVVVEHLLEVRHKPLLVN